MQYFGFPFSWGTFEVRRNVWVVLVIVPLLHAFFLNHCFWRFLVLCSTVFQIHLLMEFLWFPFLVIISWSVHGSWLPMPLPIIGFLWLSMLSIWFWDACVYIGGRGLFSGKMWVRKGLLVILVLQSVFHPTPPHQWHNRFPKTLCLCAKMWILKPCLGHLGSNMLMRDLYWHVLSMMSQGMSSVKVFLVISGSCVGLCRALL